MGLAATGGKKTGRDVGMRQSGAKRAAAHGISHEEILAFYDPGTQIMRGMEHGEATCPMTSQDLTILSLQLRTVYTAPSHAP